MTSEKFNFKHYPYLVRTTELEVALTNYEGLIPIYLKPFCNYVQYERNLKELGIYEEVMEKYYEIRLQQLQSKDKEGFCENELMEWLNENIEFNTILNNSLKKRAKNG